MFLGFFCLVAGLQFLTTGVLSELLMRTYFDGGRSMAYHTSAQKELNDTEAWHVQS
jgi:hypothetical protein